MNVSGRPHEKERKKPESLKKAQPDRSKIRMTVWFEPEVYYWLKENVSNVSKFVNNVLKSIKHQIQPAFVLIGRYEPCGGWDLNPRTPTGPDPKSGAFS